MLQTIDSPTTETDMAEQTTDCPVLETVRTHLNHEDQSLLKELLRPGASIEAIIPDDAPANELWNTLGACVHGLNLLEMRLCRLKPIIGRIIIMFEGKPSLYKELGYETYKDFLAKGVYVKLGLGRSNYYQAKLVASQWPQITPDRYAKALGPKKIEILSKFTNGKNSNAEQWLEVAESMKVSEFKTYVEQRGFIAPGECDGATFSMTTNRARLSRFNEFFDNGKIRSYVGSKDRDVILESMIEEVEQGWIEKEERAREEKRGEAL